MTVSSLLPSHFSAAVEEALAGGIRVNAVSLVQIGISADAFQEIGDQCRVVFFRQLREHLSERVQVIGALIGEKMRATGYEFEIVSAGYACLRDRPKPAVKVSPNATIVIIFEASPFAA